MHNDDRPGPEQPEDDAERERDDDLGAEGGDRDDAAPLPFAPHPDDDSPLGDTDQHSDA